MAQILGSNLHSLPVQTVKAQAGMYPRSGLESTSPSEVNAVIPWTRLSFKWFYGIQELKFNLTITTKGQEELVIVIAERHLQPLGSCH